MYKKNYTQNFMLSDIKAKINNKEKYVFDNKISKKGVFLKTLLLLLITFTCSAATFFICQQYFKINYKNPDAFKCLSPMSWLSFLCAILSCIMVISSNFCSLDKQKTLAMSYSAINGLCLGFTFVTLDLFFENTGTMVAMALLSVLMLFLLMHFAYYNNLIQVNEKFMKFVLLSLMCIFIGNIAFLCLSNVIDIYHKTFYLIFVIISLVIGCMRLAIDFHQTEQIIYLNLDKRYEWKIAFSFQITLFYIFYEILRLLLYFNMFRSRHNR